MKVTILGSGTSSGVPVIGCSCPVCSSKNPKNRRLRSSCWIQVQDKSFLIDTSPDLREQALQNKIQKVDAVLYTHIHADHIHGIDELRIYNAYQDAAIPIFGEKNTMEHLQKSFSYIFRPTSSYLSLIPRLEAHVVSGKFDCLGIPVQMIPCHHGPTHMTYNYRVANFAWLTDTNKIPEESHGYLENLDILCIDGLRYQEHPTHFHLEAAIKAAQRIKAKKTILIHLAHDYDHELVNASLPKGFELAYDGMELVL